MVALFVVCAGFHESLVGQWSWSNSVVLVVHCYFNVWQRLQTGWISFLRRREAVKHINALPSASQEQLAVHNDVCAICYQTMNLVGTVRVTRCKHFFHGNCLRKVRKFTKMVNVSTKKQFLTCSGSMFKRSAQCVLRPLR